MTKPNREGIENKPEWEKEFDKRFMPHDMFGLGAQNLRVKGKAVDVKQFIQSHLDRALKERKNNDQLEETI